MVDRKKPNTMPEADAAEVEAGTSPDLPDVPIEGETPAQRLERYPDQTGVPYGPRVGQTSVRLLFHNAEKTLSEKLKYYFLSLMER